MLSDRARDEFDGLLDGEVAALPARFRELLLEVPLIVEDEPPQRLMDELGLGGGTDLCGLHEGVALTERSVEEGWRMPDRMMLFRGPIRRVARVRGVGGRAERERLREQIHITLLHEIGHHFGLDEDDLERAGYG